MHIFHFQYFRRFYFYLVAFPDENQSQSEETVKQVADRLRKIGDDFQTLYEKNDERLPSIDNFVSSFIKQQTFQFFSNSVEELCQNTDVLDSEGKKVAFVMFLVQKLAEASKRGGGELPDIRKNIVIGEFYLKKTFGQLIGTEDETTKVRFSQKKKQFYTVC